MERLRFFKKEPRRLWRSAVGHITGRVVNPSSEERSVVEDRIENARRRLKRKILFK